MLTMNVDLQDRLINGQFGAMKHIAINDQRNISKIYIKFDDSKAGLKRISMDSLAHDCQWVPIERAEVNIKNRANKDSSPVINRIQFPLMLAWGCTVHKVQVLTLQKVVIIFDLFKQQSFNYGFNTRLLNKMVFNTRSLNKHAVGNSKDSRLLQTVILCLTKTRVIPEQDITYKLLGSIPLLA